ncbi:hypothetical protein [Marinibactrum halimedae]|uniref:Uncharacterized protein n=1 Tax=Marinibactrum halimedae TaxID=1444977 RepID=A0AA37T2B1_9GAMM|nr:hypothetical protein [Marinibactrum halimedae]MCD9457822.1 hypothetical protein [Marinibactrum halimedae]GLS24804.1 hypothetical protein GCM10007877_05180 [Marinibactrum halimedae]
MKKLLLSIFLVMASFQASADLHFTGWFKISQLFVSNANNYHFRIYGMPRMDYCSASPDWAYLNENTSGSEGKMSVLLSAYAMGKQVNLRVEDKDGGNGTIRCHIVEFFVKD